MARPIEAYVRTQRETPSDAAAIATVLQALAEAIERSRPLLLAGRRADLHERLIACQKVVLGLKAGLDPRAVPIAPNLERLYTFVEWKLGDANIHLDATALDAALGVVRDLRDGFQAVAFPGERGESR